MQKELTGANVFDEPSIWKILLKIGPPVMLAQLIQAMYNIVDSFFVGQFSGEGLAALSVIYPVQLIITAIAVGTGVGVNTQMSQDYARNRPKKADRTAGAGTVLALLSWVIFAVFSMLILRPYVAISAESAGTMEYAMIYGRIVCIGSLGVFLEGNWSKVHQASGNMRLPMIAQVAGAATNIILDPVLIFGMGPFPAMGIAGAAVATIVGQSVAALITVSGLRRPPAMASMKLHARRIYMLGYPSIFMQLLFTVYIVALNVILAGFSDQAISVLGLYYKLQSFFFIPLYGLQTCVVPLLSYTHAKEDYERVQKILWDVLIISAVFMVLGIFCFEFLPAQLLAIFSKDPLVEQIGVPAFRIIGTSFLPAVMSLMMPVFFQALGKAKPSVLLSLTRQIFCLIPIFWGLSKLGLGYTWLAFPISETITGALGAVLLYKQIHIWKLHPGKQEQQRRIVMKMITAIISKKDSDNVCHALSEAGFYFTKMASSGGFLSGGNTTVLIGTEADKVKTAMGIIRSNCSRRSENLPTTMQQGSGAMTSSTQVVVGGATVFVSEVEEFEKM